ncbi:CHAP domain-containing protein [Actinomadura montaniterrae]|uniref:CHAP domain-containing protein n=1 Tax=Actinomadura montaniterrae TaxID=1803903 RepID=A0A6L3VXH4_9ACTN|nr:CHAP domain-containing protein [Actinomadura montaniterrae]KAB2384862.1 CHAP domain-containing protein [Actinomadura montaniterrae]
MTFVQRYERLTGAMANATDMGPVLQRNGFAYVGYGIDPNVGDVAVWRNNVIAPNGHIAVVSKVTWDSPGWIITFRGANQGLVGKFTQNNCSNVSLRADLQSNKAYYYRR